MPKPSRKPNYGEDIANLSIASQAQGDIIYFNGSAWTRLGYGTSGKFLKTQGAGANPAWDSAGITFPITDSANESLIINSSILNATNAIAITLNSVNVLSNAGTRLVSIQANSVEKIAIDKNGFILAPVSGTGVTSLPYSFSGDTNTGIYSSGDDALAFVVGGVSRISISGSSVNVIGIPLLCQEFRTYGNISATLSGKIADGATSIGIILNNLTSLVTAGAKLVSFRNDSVEKAYIDKDGIIVGLFHQTSTAPTANSTGTVAIIAKDANLLTNNDGWLPLKRSDGTTVYVPYWL